MKAGQIGVRKLVDGEFVTVLLEGVQPVTVLGIPRAAVLSDQEGDYVYVVDAQSKAQVHRIQLGQSTASTAVITSGLTEGELIISEGVQRAHPVPVLLSVPVAALGAFLGILIAHLSLDLYAQIRSCRADRMSAKNGILIVEFAKDQRERGQDIREGQRCGFVR